LLSPLIRCHVMKMRRLIDTHAHLSDLGDVEGVIKRAKQAGVDAIVAVGANMHTCTETLGWAEAFTDYVFPAIGIHPTEWVEDDVPSTLQYIEAHLDGCVAVGEIGLDYWNRTEHGKPVSVHGRGSWRDALNLARQHGPEGAVFHWYSGPLDILEELLDAGYLVSATPAVEFSRDHRKALDKAPLERILIETDSPVHLRNRDRSSEPADLAITLRALAKLKDAPEEEVAEVTTGTAETFFGL